MKLAWEIEALHFIYSEVPFELDFPLSGTKNEEKYKISPYKRTNIQSIAVNSGGPHGYGYL